MPAPGAVEAVVAGMAAEVAAAAMLLAESLAAQRQHGFLKWRSKAVGRSEAPLLRMEAAALAKRDVGGLVRRAEVD